MTVNPRFLANRPAGIHSSRAWAQFGYVNRRLVDLVHTLVNESGLGPGTRLLDFGCGDQPYRALLPANVEYVGADLDGNPVADVTILDDGRLSCPDGGFDAVLSTQVLEHVQDPALYLAECARVLKPGGVILLSTHGIMYYHRDPEDYWRWTSPGLACLVESAGFSIASFHGVLGLAAASVQLFQDATQHRVPRMLRRLYFLICQTLIRVLDRRQSPQARIDNGLVIAVRAVRGVEGGNGSP